MLSTFSTLKIEVTALGCTGVFLQVGQGHWSGLRERRMEDRDAWLENYPEHWKHHSELQVHLPTVSSPKHNQDDRRVSETTLWMNLRVPSLMSSQTSQRDLNLNVCWEAPSNPTQPRKHYKAATFKKCVKIKRVWTFLLHWIQWKWVSSQVLIKKGIILDTFIIISPTKITVKM